MALRRARRSDRRFPTGPPRRARAPASVAAVWLALLGALPCSAVWLALLGALPCTAVWLAVFGALPAAAAPPPGTNIDNQGVAEYREPGTGALASAQSNRVRVTVAATESVDVEADQSTSSPGGSTVSFPHTITNTGNAATTYTIDFGNMPGDDFDLAELTLFLDQNGNGVGDSGEPTVASGGTMSLGIGESVRVVLQATVPGAALVGQSGQLQLSATGSTPSVRDASTDTVDVVGGAWVEVAKSASTLEVGPGDVVTFSLSATNTGATPADGVPVTVNGTSSVLVLVRDPIPLDTEFVGVVAAGSATPLYHAAGAPADSYTTARPGGPVDEIAFALSSLPVGQTMLVRFNVQVANGATTAAIPNTGEAVFFNGVNPGATRSPSNTVTLTLQPGAPSIAYYRNASFADPAYVASMGAPLFVQGRADSCNADPASLDITTIRIVSLLTGDEETFTATETGADTGLFRILPDVPTADGSAAAVVIGNGTVETLTDDVLTSSLTDCASGLAVEAEILIDPRGVVFDSRSNEPVAGAEVTLIDVTGSGNGNPGGPATVFEEDGFTPAPARVVTASDGRFRFPLVPPSTYRVEVVPPGDYAFPSELPPAQQPPGRSVDAAASYGGEFLVSPTFGAVEFDVPLDPPDEPEEPEEDDPGRLFIQKEASRDFVEVGEFLDYRILVRNTRRGAIAAVEVEDELPAGFRYEDGTTRLEGQALPDPEGDAGPRLRFRVGTVEGGTTVTLRYRVFVGPGSLEGDGVNTAVADSRRVPDVRSNTASARVRVVEGVFSERGFILGKVFADCDGSGDQDPGEPGVPGVTLYLEDGTWVQTDEAGQFSFYGVRPRTHGLKVDETTLPPGSRLAVLHNRFALDPGSQFVDLKEGELRRADFALAGCEANVTQAIAERRRRLGGEEAELEASLARELQTREAPPSEENVKAREATGVVDRAAPGALFEPVARPGGGLNAANSNLPERPVRPVPSVRLETLLDGLDPARGFLDPREGDVLPGSQIAVRVKGRQGSWLALSVNGVPVPRERVGQRSALPSTGVEAWEYVGVRLAPGPNTLELTEIDAFGNPRGSVSIRVTAPGELARLRIELPAEGVVADGQTAIPIQIHVEDRAGLPVTARTPLTVETTHGEIAGRDLDEVEPGFQVFAEGGRARVELVPPAEPGEGRIRVASGILEAERSVAFLPHLRPLIAIGVVEGRIDLGRLDAGDLFPSRDPDGFEDVIENFATESDDGETRAGARGAVFLKGEVKGESLLTLRYDSEKDPDERLFRDIEPDRFYPVYGDSSVRGYDAQSTSRFYARIDKERSFLLYGDYSTQEFDDAVDLGAYSRSLTGVRGHLETDRLQIDAFASQDDARQVVEEIPGRGVSGPYELDLRDIVENSEQVEIVTRDRNQPSLVLEVRPMARFSDYEVDARTGTLLFREPIPTLDSNLNPVFVRVSYEVEQGGADFWVAGASAKLKVLENLQLGARYVEDENPEDRLELASANLALEIGENTRLVAEVAESDRPEARGQAARVDLRHTSSRLDAWAYWAQTDVAFDNPSSRYAPGREEAGLKLSWRVLPRTRLFGQVLSTEDRETGGRRRGAELYVEQTLTRWLRGEVGIRHVKESRTAATFDTALAPEITPFHNTSVRARLTAQVPWWPALSVFGEYEQDLDEAQNRVAAGGGELQLANRTRLYARHEFLSSLAGPFSLNPEQSRHATLVGIESDYLPNTSVFSEYRVRDLIAGRDAEAAIGLRNRWAIARGLSLNAAFERIHAMEGPGDNESTAISLGLAYTANPLWKGTGRLEYRTSKNQNAFLHTLGLAARLDESWSLLGRSLVHVSNVKTTSDGDELLTRLQVGLAYRPRTTNRWNALGRYEFRYEKDFDEGFRRRRFVHVVSTHVDWQPFVRLRSNARYAFKWVDERSQGFDSDAFTQLLSGRLTYDLTDRWDVGILGSAFFSGAWESVQYGLGAEVGYLLTKNLWLSLGYNAFGFEDDDLTDGTYSNPGPYLRFRYKFDEDALRWLAP